jgi:hypothetical protein
MSDDQNAEFWKSCNRKKNHVIEIQNRRIDKNVNIFFGILLTLPNLTLPNLT